MACETRNILLGVWIKGNHGVEKGTLVDVMVMGSQLKRKSRAINRQTRICLRKTNTTSSLKVLS